MNDQFALNLKVSSSVHRLLLKLQDELMAGRDMAYFLAIFLYLDNAVVGTCVSFLEMLGIESLSTRITVQAARRIRQHGQKVGFSLSFDRYIEMTA